MAITNQRSPAPASMKERHMTTRLNRQRWPNHAEAAREEAQQLAAEIGRQSDQAKSLLARVNQQLLRNNPDASELLITKAALLMAEITANQERIQRILIDAKVGTAKTD